MYRSAVSRLGSLKILPYNFKKKCRGKLQEQRKKNAKKLEAQRNLRRWEAYLIARWREGDCRTEGHQSSGVKKTAELSKFCSGVNTRGMKETIERVLVLVIIKKCGTILGCMSNLGTARLSASAVATRSSPSTGLLGLLTGERTNSIPPMDFPLAKKSKITTFYTPKEKFAVLPNGVKIASQSSLLRNVNAKLGKLSINPHGLHAEMVHSGQVRFPKHRRGRVKGISCRGDHISFGRYALQALECAWITARQIEAGRRAVIRNARAGGKVWVRVIPDKSVTARPAETRMGRGKGAPAFMVACVKPGRVLYELGGVAENVARVAIKIAASKMPIRTRFIASE